MTMRAELKRPVTSTDGWNRPAKTGETSLGVIPCRVFVRSATLHQEDDKIARVDEMRGLFPIDQDIQAEDILGDVTDRQNKLLFKGPFVVKSPIRRNRHLESKLEGHAVGS